MIDYQIATFICSWGDIMTDEKHILFITHSNNDLDHFLPLFVAFKKDPTLHVTALAFYNKEELLKNKLHNYIIKENKILLDSYTDLFHFKFLSDFFNKVYNCTSRKAKMIQYTGNLHQITKKRIRLFFKSPRESFMRMLHYLSKKYIVFYTLFFMNNTRIAKYFRDKNFDLAIIDLRTADVEDLNLEPLVKMKKIMQAKTKTDDDVMFRFLSVARDQQIPILAIPHGPNYAIEDPIQLVATGFKNPFRAEYTIHCNPTGVQKDTLILGLKKDFLFGDPRYDPEWVEYIESVALKIYGKEVKKPKNKTIVLYIGAYISRHSFRISPEFHLQLHKDILSLVNYFPDIEIWMKPHPRLVFKVPIEEYVDKDRQQNIRFFGNETDTTILMAQADIVISPESSTLTIPILQKKPVIYYHRWKEKTGKASITTIFDQCPFLLKAATHEELKQRLTVALTEGKYKIQDDDITLFYNKMFSTTSPYENMTNKYIKVINTILNEET